MPSQQARMFAAVCASMPGMVLGSTITEIEPSGSRRVCAAQ
jgi:hypothetical protein